MTTPPHTDWALVDPSNHLMGVTRSVLTSAVVPTASDGQRLILTIRTASTTLSVVLTKPEADAWVAQLQGSAQQMTESGIQVVSPAVLDVLPAFQNKNGKEH